MLKAGVSLWFLTVCLFISAASSHAQELEPRRWTHMPMGSNFGGAAVIVTDGDIAFDPILRLEDVSVDMEAYAASYIHNFEFLGKSARVDVTQGYFRAKWEGLVDGEAGETSRSGWSDTKLRFSANLIGAPPLKGKEFVGYRQQVAQKETILGVGLVIMLPTGQYFEDKLLNLGSNRFTFRPQIGFVHNRGPWSFELTASSWWRTDNTEFFNGRKLETEALFALQSHLIYTIKPGLWLGASAGYGYGGRSTVDGEEKNDRRSQLSWALSVGIPINRSVGIKFAYVATRAQVDIGNDLDSLAAAIAFLW